MKIEYKDLGKTIYYNPTWYENLRVIKQMVKHDRDCIGLIVGRRRSGKSVLAQQALKFLDPTFDCSRIVYTVRDFVKLCNTLGPNKAVLLDESRSAASGEWAHSEESKILLDYLNEIGQKNLYILMLMPDFWDFRTTLATQLSHFMIHVYEIYNDNWNPDDVRSDPLQRGTFDFYDFETKRSLYYSRKKERSYRGFKVSFRGDFTNVYAVDEDDYRKLKSTGLDRFHNIFDPKPSKEREDIFSRGAEKNQYHIKDYIKISGVIKNLEEANPQFTLKDISIILKLPYSTVQTQAQEKEENNGTHTLTPLIISNRGEDRTNLE